MAKIQKNNDHKKGLTVDGNFGHATFVIEKQFDPSEKKPKRKYVRKKKNT